MPFSLRSTIPAASQEEFEHSKDVYRRILERQIQDDLEALIDARHQLELPGPIALVNEDTRINLIERITKSLGWFYARLFPAVPAQASPDFQKLLEPVYDPQAGEVTTGAYLVLHALSRSYLGFTQPRFHDFVSSVLAREDLIANRIYSAVFAGHVATLIEFQNAVRTALLSKEEGEVGVWTGTEFKLGLDIIAPVLVREILKQWQQGATTTSDIVLQAHLAVALSYENRWTQSVASASSSRLQEQIKNSASFLAVSQEIAAAAEGALCIFEFASYAVGKGGLEKFAQAALSRIASGLGDIPRAWLSFGRFWSNNEAANLRQWLAEKGDLVNFAVDKYAGLANLRPQPKEQLPTYFGYLDLKPADRFEVVFGKQLSKAAASPTAWDLLEAAFQWFTGRRYLGGQAPVLPVAAVGSILKMLEVMYPEQFCCVRLNQTHPQVARGAA